MGGCVQLDYDNSGDTGLTATILFFLVWEMETFREITRPYSTELCRLNAQIIIT